MIKDYRIKQAAEKIFPDNPKALETLYREYGFCACSLCHSPCRYKQNDCIGCLDELIEECMKAGIHHSKVIKLSNTLIDEGVHWVSVLPTCRKEGESLP